ncbi:MAG TPA: M13 family metallopeptidase [Kofleriaceae bacterium]|nr:M13 family metallopeptidase [Kofleriaceae bacterium]
MRRSSVVLFLAAACGAPARSSSPPVATASAPASAAPAAAPERITLAVAGVDPTWMDRSADPCDDFYRFACGAFLDHAEIPADLASWRPATQVRKSNEDFLHETLERARTAPDSDPVLGRLGAYYGSCMDEPAIEQAGVAPVKPLLDAVDAIRDARTLDQAIFALHRAGVRPYFGLYAIQDLRNSQRTIAWLDQSGLGLPEREYYLATDAHARELRGKYQSHVARMLELAGAAPAAAAQMAGEIMRLETELARISRPLVERRDSLQIYHKIDRAGVLATAKRFSWNDYFAALGVPDLQDINVTSPPYLGAMAELLRRERPAAWKPYLRWRVLGNFAPALSKAFVEEDFAMRRILTGQTELEPRWKICVRATNEALTELLAQPYVAARYSAKARAMTLDLIDHVRAAMRADLAQLSWMDDPTRAAAQAKLGAMRNVIGYPSRPKPYEFEIRRAAFGANVIASARYEVQRALRKIGGPVDLEDWDLSPVTVDAFYSATLNSMNFPAGILQPPFFSERFIAAANYGQMGTTNGHELTHGFDDDGAKYDGTGNLHDWWSAASQRAFKERTKCVIDQYSAYEPLPGIKVNGALTVGENIADIGGVKLAFAAYRLARAGQSPLSVDGFTEDQVFFIAHAQGWCDKTRPEVVEMNLKTDPHTPRKFRVNGVLADSPEFAAAFSCAAGRPMNPTNRCEVW